VAAAIEQRGGPLNALFEAIRDVGVKVRGFRRTRLREFRFAGILRRGGRGGGEHQEHRHHRFAD
jgi:hypothetical protein